jgi:MFS family permease
MRRAHRATLAVFLLTGVVFATFASRITALQDRLELEPGTLSLAFLALNAGAVAGLPAGGRLSSRHGARATMRCGFAVYPAALVAAGLAPSLPWLCLALVAMAAGNSVIDVAMNVEGVELERRAGRPLLSGLHAGHSFGVLAGAALGFGAAAIGVPAPLHFAAVAVPAAAAALLATAPVLDTRGDDDEAGWTWPGRRTALLGLLAFCAFLCEGGGNDWSAVHVRTAHDTGEALAAAGFLSFALALALARLAGDRIVARAGRAGAVRASGLLTAAGAVCAITAPVPAQALVGWALTGAGLALLAPAIVGAAPDAAGTAAPAAIAAVTSCGYLGSFTGPPLIGALAEATSLPAALGLLVGAAMVVAALAPRALTRQAAWDHSGR